MTTTTNTSQHDHYNKYVTTRSIQQIRHNTITTTNTSQHDHYNKYVTTRSLQQIRHNTITTTNTSQHDHYNKYVTTRPLQQIRHNTITTTNTSQHDHYNKYVTTRPLQQIRHNTITTTNTSQHDQYNFAFIMNSYGFNIIEMHFIWYLMYSCWSTVYSSTYKTHTLSIKTLKSNIFSLWTLFKYINIQNNHSRGASYMDILVNRTLYMFCQAGPALEPLTVRTKGERSPHWANVADNLIAYSDYIFFNDWFLWVSWVFWLIYIFINNCNTIGHIFLSRILLNNWLYWTLSKAFEASNNSK